MTQQQQIAEAEAKANILSEVTGVEWRASMSGEYVLTVECPGIQANTSDSIATILFEYDEQVRSVLRYRARGGK